MRIIIILAVYISCAGCIKGQKKMQIHILIPLDYSGWVNIIFDDTTSQKKPFAFNDGFVYLISGDPSEFRLNSSIFPSGKSDMYYYYYNIDTTITLSWLDYPNKNIFFERTISRKNSIDKKELLAFSFYVSKEPLNVDSLSVDKVMKNSFLNK